MLGAMSPEPLDPIVAETVVPVTPRQAFVGFTAQMGEWWDPMLTPDPSTFTGIAIEPDGDVAMVHGEDEYVWGHVSEWDPLGRYRQDFWLSMEQSEPTVLDVRFIEDDQGTRVRLSHEGWREGQEGLRQKFGHWDDLLARFAAHVS
jgi:hypothetical protein